MEMTLGNITTLATWIGGLIIPFLGMYEITQDQLTSIITALIIVAWLIFNSKNPNSLDILGNGTADDADDYDEPLNDEYVY